MFVLLLTGCISGSDLSSIIPTVKFNSLELTALSWETIDVDFKFDVHNPNPVDLPLQRFNYGLDLREISILEGNTPEGLDLTAEADSLVRLPVSLSFAGIYDAVEASRGVDILPFGLRGGFGWDTDIGPVDITFDEGGDFPALRVPDIQLGDLGVVGVDAASANFNLGIDVDNDHGSTLDFLDTAFNVEFAGVKVGKGKEDSIGSVEGASQKTLDIPFSVDYIDAIDAIASVASGDPIEVDFSADMDVDTPFGLVPLNVDKNGNLKVRDETE
jgi:LEA14-like dessication related protein